MAHPLADTSALVLLWCGKEIYRSGAVERYARRLDLRNGEELLQRCNAVWPDYGSVIRYRKLCIGETACSILREGGIRQVIIPAAGFSMLGIELAALFPELDVFELDRDYMEVKQELTSGLPYAENSRLHCLTADIGDIRGSVSMLAGAGWKRSEPSLLIIEGISYYLPKEAIRKQWEIVADGSPVILEYLVPDAAVDITRRYIPEKIFREIMTCCSSNSPITCWSEEELGTEKTVTLKHCFSLSDIEKNINGIKNKLFSERKKGWIEIAVLCRNPHP
jgi:O-methyltransferase involved in polyketide biosynthesis